jgi:translation initiation factor IF-2
MVRNFLCCLLLFCCKSNAHLAEYLLIMIAGTLESLKNVKKDVMEMRKGTECGIGFDGWAEFEVGDQIQAYETIEEKRYL